MTLNKITIFSCEYDLSKEKEFNACDDFVCFISVDTTPPNIRYCPNDINEIIELGMNGTSVFWNEPNVTDPSGKLQKMQSHIPPSEFPTGVTPVNYAYTDASNNTAYCNFTVTIGTG